MRHTSDNSWRLWTQGYYAKFLGFMSSYGLRRRVEPGAANQTGCWRRRTAYDEALELAAVAVGIYCLASTSYVGSSVASVRIWPRRRVKMNRASSSTRPGLTSA